MKSSHERKLFLKNHGNTFNEFFWMTLASIFPVLLAWLFLGLNEHEIGFKEVILNVFLDGPIFAYVAALLAPFLFLIAKVLSGIKNDKLKFGGLSLFVALILTILSVFLFYDKQEQLIKGKYESEKNTLLLSFIEPKIIEKAILSIPKEKQNITNKTSYSFRDYLALSCYILALILFYYSIYINNKEVPAPADQARQRNEGLQKVLNQEFGDQ